MIVVQELVFTYPGTTSLTIKKIGFIQNPLELLALVGLENNADLLVSQYSKGMKNRLSVARALLHQPELIFVDEPTAGLDPGSARRIKDSILAQKERGATIFLTTHDMHVTNELCDRVAFIVDGQIKLIDSAWAPRLRHGREAEQLDQNADFRLLLRRITRRKRRRNCHK